MNPYLPSWEYIPDGEPHVFGDRVYVYGSHDRFNGYAFCLNDYVCYSAPVTDLADWRYEGVIYKRTDDPKNPDGEMCLYAPDVTQGADGRYYLYYVLDQLQIVSVAVCDTPGGKYEFYGYVHYQDGTHLGEGPEDEPQFDPGVLFEDNKVYLYTGFCQKNDFSRSGPMVTVLDSDMVTILEKPVFIAPSAPYSEGSGYEGHTFFEAPSIRKVGNTYYFVYSTNLHHELCYATCDTPTGKFKYGGIIVSNRDLGVDTYKPADKPMYYGGNNHGGIECINGQWYIFYHRHTNNSPYCRQGCIEPITILPDGSIPQVEITSSGATGPFTEKGLYPAYLACHLLDCHGEPVLVNREGVVMNRLPYITQDGRDGDELPAYIYNMNDGAMAGFKYFNVTDVQHIEITYRGGASSISQYTGTLEVLDGWDGQLLTTIPIRHSNEWRTSSAPLSLPQGKTSLYFRYRGPRTISFKSFALL